MARNQSKVAGMKKRRKPKRSEIARIKAKGASPAKETAAATPNTASDHLGLRGKCLVVLFLVVAVLIPYGQVLGFDFVNFDDYQYVKDNPRVNAGLTVENVIWAFTTGEFSNWHPLTWLSYMLDVQIFGATNAAAFHMVNVLFHAVNSALLFLLLYRMTRALWPSVLVAALFAVHPLHVESVAWISERKDVLSTFFWLLTMMAYVRYVASPGLRYLPVVVFFVLGLMAKPMLVTLPAVLLLMDYWPLRRLAGVRPMRGRFDARWQWLVIEKLPLFALAVGSSVVTIFVQAKGQSVVELERLPLWARPANAIVSYAKYIVMTVVPKDLAVYYPHPGPNLALWQVLVAGAFLVAVSVLVVWWRKSHPYLLVGWLWYLGTLVPVIGLLQVGEQALADRYTYVPLIGLFIAAAWGIPDLAARCRVPKKALGFGGAALLIALTVGAAIQTSHWRNSRTLWEHALQATSSNYKALNNLGAALAKQGHLDECKVHFLKAIKLQPDSSKAYQSLGAALLNQGNLDEAKVHLLKAVELKPDYVDAHIDLGTVLVNQGRVDEGKAHFLKALDIKPGSARASQKLGTALANQGRLDEAKAHFLKALELQPDSVDAHNNLGVLLVNQGRVDEGKAHLWKALEIDPDSVDAHNNLGAILANEGHPDEAKIHFQKAKEAKSDSVDDLTGKE